MQDVRGIFETRGYLPRAAVAPPSIDEKMLQRMRAQQLRDLATAYGQTVVGNTKSDALMVCLAALGNGVFDNPPSRPEYLVKAASSSDEKRVRPVDWERHALPEVDVDNFLTLKRIAKRAGINSFGKSKAALTEELKAAGVI